MTKQSINEIDETIELTKQSIDGTEQSIDAMNESHYRNCIPTLPVLNLLSCLT